MSEETKKQYELFDIDRKDFITKKVMNKTTNKHIKAVSRVQALNESLSQKARAKYATQAGLPKKPIRNENDKIIGYEHDLDNVYDELTASAALAEVLFKDCPKLLEVKGESVSIVDEELFDALDAGVVNRCFLDFQMQRRGTPTSLHL